jgi:hypothetical protein
MVGLVNDDQVEEVDRWKGLVSVVRWANRIRECNYDIGIIERGPVIDASGQTNNPRNPAIVLRKRHGTDPAEHIVRGKVLDKLVAKGSGWSDH